MAVKDNARALYLDQLNAYHCELASCAELAAFLLDCADDKASEEWHKSGSWLMRNLLLDLAERLPFPV